MASNSSPVREQLSVTTAIIGLLAVGGNIIDTLWDLDSLPSRAKSALVQALHEVKQCRSTVHILYKTFALVESAQLPFPQRGTWIKAEHLIATLADTVLAVSELQGICEQSTSSRSGLTSEETNNHGPPPYDEMIKRLCSRIRWHNLSMTLIMTILKCPGESDAHNSRVGLERRMTRLLSANTSLADRMRHLDGFASPRLSYHSTQGAPSGLSGTADTAAAAAAAAGIVSQDDAAPLSPFSSCTLADVPILSMIPLPVSTSELVDGGDFYTLAYARRVSHDLSELMRNQAGQGTSRSLGVILGWTNTGVGREGGCASSTGSSNDSSPVVVETEPDIQTKAKKWRVRSFKVRRRWRA